MFEFINQAALDLGRFVYPPNLPIREPKGWAKWTRMEKLRYPPYRLYHWVLLAITTKRSRLRLKHRNEGLFIGEAFERWYEQNQAWIVKQWG